MEPSILYGCVRNRNGKVLASYCRDATDNSLHLFVVNKDGYSLGNVSLNVRENIALDEHYNLRAATTGEEALEIAADFQPNVILLDIMLSGIDGYEVCQRLREKSTFQNTVIIMVSAKGTVSERYEGHKVGADDYVTKPFDENELLESVAFFFKKGMQTDSK